MATRLAVGTGLWLCLAGCNTLPFLATQSCAQDADCSAGLTCSKGVCAACPACGPAEVCLLGGCAPTSCGAVACADGAACFEGRCVPVDCAGRGCPPGELCAAGRCVPTRCADAACSPGQACVEGRCVDPGCWGVGCAQGTRCLDGACVPCAAEVCSGGADDDCDGLTDCADPDCFDQDCGPAEACAQSRCQAGACLPIPVAGGTVCRPAAGACDLEERCDGLALGCPPDTLEDPATVCRPAVDLCDAPDLCDGLGPDCPVDALQASGWTCRPSAGPCDPDERCSGVAVRCPDDLKAPATTPCRVSQGACDPAEACDGVAASCPADLRLGAGIECAAPAGPCEGAAVCDGSAAACPQKALLGTSVVCRPALEACDAVERCDGLGAACPPDLLQPAGTPCATGATCTGTSPTCPGAAFPTPPVFVSLTPASPSRVSTTPRVKGLCSADTVTVGLFSNAGCTAAIGSGTKGEFEAAGILVTVPSNASTTLYAVATNAAVNSSPCTFLATYVHDSVGPTAPTFTRTDPATPAGTTFAVIGTASADSVTVSVHADAACSGAVGSGSRAVFQAAGVAVTLAANVVTPLYGQATDAAGNPSACVAFTVYQPVAGWTWVSGSSLADQTGVHGTLRTPAAANHPGSREWSLAWAKGSEVWIFGGSGCAANNCKNQSLNDLWRFDGGLWTWWAGATVASARGTYGTLGVPAASNTPGARYQGTAAQDAAGNLWLFGGWGNGASGPSDGELNDLWRFDGTNWTWMAGSDAINRVGVYGSLGVAAAGNVPGGRDGGVAWVDAAGHFWLYGGTGCDSASCVTNTNLLQDVWRFDGTNWTWMAGPKTANAPASHGVLGSPAASNLPGGRHLSVGLPASPGVWMFGGYGLDAVSTKGDLNDLWRFDGTNWAWVGGPKPVNGLGVYGQRGVPAATNWPGARDTAAFAASGAGGWLYGGVGCDSATCDTTSNFLGDLWRWDGSGWVWLTGSSLADERPNHGQLGVPAASNRPGGRKGAGGGEGPSGALWIFGGRGYDSTGSVGRLGDLWRYQ